MFTGLYWHDIHVGLLQPECETVQSKLSGNLVYGVTWKSFWYQEKWPESWSAAVITVKKVMAMLLAAAK